jgi:hypothetical protein
MCRVIIIIAMLVDDCYCDLNLNIYRYASQFCSNHDWTSQEGRLRRHLMTRSKIKDHDGAYHIALEFRPCLYVVRIFQSTHRSPHRIRISSSRVINPTPNQTTLEENAHDSIALLGWHRRTLRPVVKEYAFAKTSSQSSVSVDGIGHFGSMKLWFCFPGPQHVKECRLSQLVDPTTRGLGPSPARVAWARWWSVVWPSSQVDHPTRSFWSAEIHRPVPGGILLGGGVGWPMFLHRRWEDVAISAHSRHVEGWATTATILWGAGMFLHQPRITRPSVWSMGE